MRRGRQPRERERGRDGGRGRRQTDSRDQWRERSTHARWRLRNSARVLSAVAAAAAVAVSSRETRGVSGARSVARYVHAERNRGSRVKERPRESNYKSVQDADARTNTHTHGGYVYFGSVLLCSLLDLLSTFRLSLARSLARARARIPDSPKDGSFLSLSHLCSRRRTSRTVLDTRSRRRERPGNMKTPMENQLSWLALFMTALYSREYFIPAQQPPARPLAHLPSPPLPPPLFLSCS